MKPQVPTTKTEYVYDLIRNDILAAKLAPGHRLRLTELADMYQISEMPIREALRMLQREGFVVFESHRGATVVELSMHEVFDIIAIRTYLEILAISEAVPFHNERSLKALDELIAQMKDTRTSHRFSEANRGFHRALYAPCKNEFLKAEIDNLWDRVWQRWSRSIFELRPERKEAANREHEAIVAAVRSGSVSEVCAAANVHREHTLREWKEALETLSLDERP